MELSDNAKIVLEKRYLLKDSSGRVAETPKEMFMRVARNIAGAEKIYGGDTDYWTEKYYDLMVNLKFLPNSPALMNAGKAVGQLAACFVLPVEDSMNGIFDTLKTCCADPAKRRRNRLFLLPAPPNGRYCAINRRHGQRTCFFYEGV